MTKARVGNIVLVSLKNNFIKLCSMLHNPKSVVETQDKLLCRERVLKRALLMSNMLGPGVCQLARLLLTSLSGAFIHINCGASVGGWS